MYTYVFTNYKPTCMVSKGANQARFKHANWELIETLKQQKHH